MIKAVIFDCFGVLIGDGLEIAVGKLEKTDPELRNFVKNTIYQTNRGLLTAEQARLMISDRIGVTSGDWFRLIRSGEARNEDVISLVKELRANYKTALLSNVPKSGLDSRFSAEELNSWFDAVVVSGEVGIVKPDPEIYRMTAEKLGVEPVECIFIDDRENYTEAARTVGMQAIWFQDFKQMKQELDALLK